MDGTALFRLRRVCAVLCMLGAGSAFSQIQWNTRDGVEYVQSAAQRVVMQHRKDQAWQAAGSLERQLYGIPGNAGAVSVVDKYKGPSPKVGEIIDVDVKRTLPWSKITKAAAKSLPLISTAVALKEIMDAIRCREAPGGAAECDAGAQETAQYVYKVNKSHAGQSGFFVGGSVAAVCNTAAQGVAASGSGGGYVWSVVSVTVTPDSEYPYLACSQVVIRKCNPVAPQGNGACSNESSGPWGVTRDQQLACAPIVVNGVTLFPVKGPDGKCPTNIYSPASEDDVATKGETWGDKSKAPQLVGELGQAGKPIEHDPPVSDPVPDSVVGPRETTTHPDGSTTIRDTVWDLVPTADGYGWSPRVVVKDYAPGAVIPPPGEVSGGTSTTGTTPKEEVITCGLPGKPPCKIDETGTPTTGTISKEEVNVAKGEALGKITELGTIQAPAWSWSFALPTGCSAIAVGPFLTRTVTVDLCAYQGLIHDLVALLWASATVWVCVGMVGRAFSAG